MSNLCPAITSLPEFWCHLDYWAARYQSGFFALLAVIIAFNQWRISQRQHQISARQNKMSEAQNATSEAIALIRLDPFLDQAHRAFDRIISMGRHRDTGARVGIWPVFDWDTEVLAALPDVEVPSDIGAIAIAASAADAANLVQLASAISDAKQLAAEFKEAPWHSHRDLEGFEADARALEKDRATDDALNRLFRFANMTGKLLAARRSI